MATIDELKNEYDSLFEKEVCSFTRFKILILIII